MFSLSTSSLVLMFSIEYDICSGGSKGEKDMSMGERNKNRRFYHLVKRMIDVVLSLFGLVLISPFVVIIAILIKIDSKGPVFFKHHRIGKNGKPFSMYKFRTMKDGAEAMINDFTPEQLEEWNENFKLKDDPRITRIGKFLRKTSLDELPQLVNILRGDMSIVGPRPVIEVELEEYGNDKDEFLSIRPGLTGWWASNGRSEISYPERCSYELYYVRNESFWLDVKVMFLSVFSVFLHKGAR